MECGTLKSLLCVYYFGKCLLVILIRCMIVHHHSVIRMPIAAVFLSQLNPWNFLPTECLLFFFGFFLKNFLLLFLCNPYFLNSMPCSGCLTLHGVKPDYRKTITRIYDKWDQLKYKIWKRDENYPFLDETQLSQYVKNFKQSCQGLARANVLQKKKIR